MPDRYVEYQTPIGKVLVTEDDAIGLHADMTHYGCQYVRLLPQAPSNGGPAFAQRVHPAMVRNPTDVK